MKREVESIEIMREISVEYEYHEYDPGDRLQPPEEEWVEILSAYIPIDGEEVTLTESEKHEVIQRVLEMKSKW